jgi:phosphoglycolate phosphatase
MIRHHQNGYRGDGCRMNSKELVLFDLDGVIIDSRLNMESAWHAVRVELNVEVPFERYFAEIGRPFIDIMGRLGLTGIATEIERVFRRASSDSLSTTPFFVGMPEVLSALADGGSRLGIVTSKDAVRTQLVMDRLPKPPHIVVTPNSQLRGKPAPDPLLMAMATANIDPEHTVYIGDMSSDAEAARRARIDYIHVNWGYGSAPTFPHYTADSPNDLHAMLQREGR